MNMLTIFLVYVLNVRTEGDLCEVKKVFLLENDFWCFNEDKVKTNQGYFSTVGVCLQHKKGFTDRFDHDPETCYFLKSTNLKYLVLENTIQEGITSFLKSSEDDKFSLRFFYFFTDKPIENFNSCNYNKTNILGGVTYKFLKKLPKNENIINLRLKESDIHIEHIKERIGEILSMCLSRFKIYIKVLIIFEEEIIKLMKDADLNLFYFKSHSECLSNLEKLIIDFKCLKLIKDEIADSLTSESSIDMTTILKISKFKERLFQKFNKNIKKPNEIEIYGTMEELLDECCDYLKNVMNNNISFPIGGKYDVDYYIEELSNLIFISAKERQEKDSLYKLKDKNFKSYKKVLSCNFELQKMQFRIMKDLCESGYVLKPFSKLLGKEIKTLDDYINIDKIVIDYYNMLEFIESLYLRSIKNSCSKYSHVSPIFVDNYNTRIITGIKINSSSKLMKIKGFDDKGKEIIIMKDTDYFIDKLGVLYCPSDILSKKNIHEIEASSSDEKNSMRFKVNKYLIV